MEIREYAETILFSEALEDKLVSCGKPSDAKRGKGLGAVKAPARPDRLRLDDPRPRVPFPTVHDMEDPKKRGAILHFFANHELLALELMALTLLRFPDAPSDFRRTLVVTMRDEQRHLKLYLERMKSFGVSFGDIPVNAFFWTCISDVESPLDFTARMSLTFEQANLDFSLHYLKQFERLGDTESADIMQQVLQDEIAHVRHGVRFFERWKKPVESIWEAYVANIKHPLTPARARGIGFSVEARRKAGLNDDFINRLRVASHSKGRPPHVHLFNPATEAALAYGDEGYTPPKQVVALARDLETLPMFLASTEDAVLVRKTPSTAYLSELLALGFNIPEFIEADLDARRLPKDHPLTERQLAELKPWGRDPTLLSFVAPVARNEELPPSWREPVPPAAHALVSKAWLAEKRPALLQSLPDDIRNRCVTDAVAQVATSLDEVEHIAQKLFAHGHHFVVAKAPFGASGQAAIRFDQERFDPTAKTWMNRILQTQQSLLIEPWYRREIDLSFQFRVDAQGQVKRVGLTRFFTDGRGRFRGVQIGPLSAGLSPEVHHFVFRATNNPKWIGDALAQCAGALAPHFVEAGITGRAGLDAMVVSEPGSKRLRLVAPLELNPRPTMGHVALALRRIMSGGAHAFWLLLTRKDLETSGHSDFSALLKALKRHLPQERTRGNVPQLRQGVFTTNDPNEASYVLGTALVAMDASTLTEALKACGLEDPTQPVVLSPLN